MNEIYQRGRCIGSGRHELFFSESPSDLAAAQAICGGCDVRLACLRSALDAGLEWGVWGGVIFWDGQPYYRKRGRGRPAKHDQHLPLEASYDDLRQMVRSA